MKDLELGRALRDEGAKLALENAGEEWSEMAATLVLKYFDATGEALFEDAREYAIKCGVGAPPSPNSWGAVALALSKRNLIVKTGALLPSKAVKSHGRSQPVWRSINREQLENDSLLHVAIRKAVEAEREACAKVCEAFSVDRGMIDDEILKTGVFSGASMCALAIRERGAP